MGVTVAFSLACNGIGDVFRDVGKEVRSNSVGADSVCVDAAGFVDAQGYACADWVGYPCDMATENWHYSTQQESDILAMCPRSCGLCEKTPCTDTQGFVDARGYACAGWVGYACDMATKDWGYTTQQESDILAQCRQSCGLCSSVDHCPDDPNKTEPGVCGCGKPEGTCGTGDKARWSFLVFMNGDNDLEPYVTHDLNELEQVGSGDGVNVVVQADRIKGHSNDDGDWTNTRRYYITHDDDTNNVTSKVVEDLGELDMGDPAVLSDFLIWAHKNYPAERVALSMWNHGNSWRSNLPKITRSISSDSTSNSEIMIARGDLNHGLAAIVAARGPLDLVAFDACLMGSWEVAHSLQGYALNMAGSETLVGGEGYLYANALSLLRDVGADADGATLADEMARSTVQGAKEWTHSAIDITSLGPITSAIDALATQVLSNHSLKDPLLSAREQARGADADWKNWYLDLNDLGTALATSKVPQLQASGQAIQEGIDAAVISVYGNSPYDWTGGMTIWFDYDSGESHLTEYAQGTWAKDTSWDDLLMWLSKN
jgi:hypothetical protein